MWAEILVLLSTPGTRVSTCRQPVLSVTTLSRLQGNCLVSDRHPVGTSPAYDQAITMLHLEITLSRLVGLANGF